LPYKGMDHEDKIAASACGCGRWLVDSIHGISINVAPTWSIFSASVPVRVATLARRHQPGRSRVLP